MTNFRDIRQKAPYPYYYVDKTKYIKTVEDSNNFYFFIRPRRFGKTLFMEMMKYYYDVKWKEEWEDMFGGLWIGSHPTPLRSSFLVIGLDFSIIDGGLNDYRGSMDEICSTAFEDFADRYSDILSPEFKQEVKGKKGAVAQLNFICTRCKNLNLPLYLFIDEYDHFTNDILSDATKLKAYEDETHGEGYLRKFFNAIKEGSKTSLKKIFITGVSPVTMDDVTSGFNIGTNYTSDSCMNAAMGFTETEVRDMLAYYEKETETFKHTVDELIEIMKPWYNHYCFAEECLEDPSVFNSDMVLHFVHDYLRQETIPRQMIDDNVRTDYNKLRMLIRKDHIGESSNLSKIQQIARDGCIVSKIVSNFPARDIIKDENFISLLYYFGLLTISGRNEYGEIVLGIPNKCIEEQTYRYLLDAYEDNGLTANESQLRLLLRNMAFKGDYRPFFQFESDTLKHYSTHREKQQSEALIQSFIKGQICLNPYYLSLAEEDLLIDAGYADLYFMPRREQYPAMQYAYIIELKYAKPDATEAVINSKLRDAVEKANRYAASEKVQTTLQGTTLKKIVALFKGVELLKCCEIEELEKEFAETEKQARE